MRYHFSRKSSVWAPALVTLSAGVPALCSAGSPAFDFSTTEAAKHLPAGYFEKHVRDGEAYAGWVQAYPDGE